MNYRRPHKIYFKQILEHFAPIKNKMQVVGVQQLASCLVELEGFEPSSKRGTNKLSTCLVGDLFFDCKQAHDYRLAA